MAFCRCLLLGVRFCLSLESSREIDYETSTRRILLSRERSFKLLMKTAIVWPVFWLASSSYLTLFNYICENAVLSLVEHCAYCSIIVTFLLSSPTKYIFITLFVSSHVFFHMHIKFYKNDLKRYKNTKRLNFLKHNKLVIFEFYILEKSLLLKYISLIRHFSFRIHRKNRILVKDNNRITEK